MRRNKEKFDENKIFTYHKIWSKKPRLRSYLKLKDKHHIFGDHTTNICKVLEDNLMQCRQFLPILAFNRKMFYQTLSSLENLITVLSFRFSVLSSLVDNSINYMRGVCDCVKITTPPAYISKCSYKKNLTKIV